MARISTYPLDTNLAPADKWIGSDSTNKKKTVNFSLESVSNWLNTSAAIDSQTLRFKYQASATDANRMKASISLDVDEAAPKTFSSVSKLVFSINSLKYASQGASLNISNFYKNPLIGSYVLISNVSDVSIFGIYLWNTAVEQVDDNLFYDIGLTYVTGNGTLENTKDYFISLLQYDVNAASGDKTEVFTQGTAAATWVIDHSLNKFASVTIVDSAEQTVIGNVVYNSNSQITVTFNNPFSGKAFLN
tara:strand:- start:1142 stop:1882 length:741 start_codon:yes stop_codon:yes gene_type:complete